MHHPSRGQIGVALHYFGGVLGKVWVQFSSNGKLGNSGTRTIGARQWDLEAGLGSSDPKQGKKFHLEIMQRCHSGEKESEEETNPPR